MRFSKITVILILLTALCVCRGLASENDGSAETRTTEFRDLRLNLAPFINFGMVVGEASELIEEWGGSTTDKTLYGGGLSITYFLAQKIGVGLNSSYHRKPIPGDFTPHAHGWMYSGSLVYNLGPHKRTFPYVRGDVGALTASYKDRDLGTYTYIRLGAGIFSRSSSSVGMRFELFYQRAFSEGRTIEDLWNYDVDFMAECIAIEIGVAIPLMSR